MRHFPVRISRYWPAAVAGSAAVALAATMTATATAATRTAESPAGPHSVTRYAVGKRACTVPARPHTATCYAEIRTVVRKGTPGARAFKEETGATKAGTIGPAGGLTPGDLATAYGLPTTGGHGQTVAIVDAYNDPNINADLQTFDSHYGLAACSTTNGCLRVVNQTGGATPPANDTSGWSVEESLDVEAVHSVCQGCKIILVEANSDFDNDLAIAENKAVALGANEVTNSFGAPENGSTTSFQNAFNHPGVVITASAGDDGYYDYDAMDSVNRPNIPAAYNTTVSVGGTSLYLGQTAARQSETVWNDNGARDYDQQLTGAALGASGGGCSTMFSAQAVADLAQHLGQYRVWQQAAGLRRLGGGGLPDRARRLRLRQLRVRVQPGAGLVHRRRHVPVVADHRGRLCAGRRRPGRAVPGAHPVRAPEPGPRRHHRRKRLVRRRGRRGLPQPELARVRHHGLRLHGRWRARRGRPGL